MLQQLSSCAPWTHSDCNALDAFVNVLLSRASQNRIGRNMRINFLRFTLNLGHFQSMFKMILFLLWTVWNLTVLLLIPLSSIGALVNECAICFAMNPGMINWMVFSGRSICRRSSQMLTYIKQRILTWCVVSACLRLVCFLGLTFVLCP